MIEKKKALYGERLKGIPLLDLRLPELAQLYAYLVQNHGEDNSNCYEVLNHLKRLEDSKGDKSIQNAYEEGYQQAVDDMDTYDDGFDAGYEAGYNRAKSESE